MPACWIECVKSHELLSFKRCLDCAANYEGQLNPATGQVEMCDFRYPQLKAMFSGSEGRKDAGVSSTMLTGCLRSKWFDIHRNYAIQPQKQMPAENGTAWHSRMDEYPQPGTYGEQRLLHVLPSGQIFTGQFDRLIPVPLAHRTQPDDIREYWIEDYKRKEDGKIKRMRTDDYAIQLNIYRFMIERGSTNIRTGEIYEPGAKVTKLTLLPSSHSEQGKVINVPLMDLDLLQEYLEEVLELYAAGTLAVPPPRDADPERNYFCMNWCKHRDACIRAGGRTYDPKMNLVEGMFAHGA